MPKNSSYYKRDDGLMSMKVRDLEEANMQLQQNLGKNAQDFKDLLVELDSLRKQVQSKDEELMLMQSEIRMRPNLAQMNSKKVQIDHLSAENEDLQKKNNELHNEIMQLRNQTQTLLTDNGGFHA